MVDFSSTLFPEHQNDADSALYFQVTMAGLWYYIIVIYRILRTICKSQILIIIKIIIFIVLHMLTSAQADFVL